MDWECKDLFDERFITVLKDKLTTHCGRIIRIFIILSILIQFFNIGIAPTESMSPTIQPNDLLLFQKNTSFERGDIVFFTPPIEGETKLYLKRVIGLPGEEIEVKNGSVSINGNPLIEDYLYEEPVYEFPKTLIPEGHYFMLGDNRNNSVDSSVWGFVSKDKCKGKVIAIMLPIGRFKLSP